MFPGEHHLASFSVQEANAAVNIKMKSADEAVTVEIEGNIVNELPSTSIFSSLADASSFFECGSLGYSVTSDQNRLDGLMLKTKDWRVEPLAVTKVHSSYFLDEAKFPRQSVEFDHALIMRNVAHEWHSVDDLYL